jgi:hypothetical protein
MYDDQEIGRTWGCGNIEVQGMEIWCNKLNYFPHTLKQLAILSYKREDICSGVKSRV